LPPNGAVEARSLANLCILQFWRGTL